MSEPIIRRLALIGVGLIGGSLVKSLRRAGAVVEIVGNSRTEATQQKALSLGVVDRIESDLEKAVEGSDLVVIATPMQTMPGLLASLNRYLEPHAVVTDVGSVKAFVNAAANAHMPDHARRFVPAHPIAGREHSGVEASEPDLFEGKTVVLTPVADTDPQAVTIVEQMWRQTGAHTVTLDAQLHDELLAATSHLPHIVAYALVGYLASLKESDRLFELAAAGFYDFTRIASSDPVMWRDICITNRDEITTALEGYRDNIEALLDAIKTSDGDELHRYFAAAKRSRDAGLISKSDRDRKQ